MLPESPRLVAPDRYLVLFFYSCRSVISYITDQAVDAVNCKVSSEFINMKQEIQQFKKYRSVQLSLYLLLTFEVPSIRIRTISYDLTGDICRYFSYFFVLRKQTPNIVSVGRLV